MQKEIIDTITASTGQYSKEPFKINILFRSIRSQAGCSNNPINSEGSKLTRKTRNVLMADLGASSFFEPVKIMCLSIYA